MKEIELVSAGTATSDLTSVGYSIGDLRDYGLQVVFSSATLEGVLSIQGSLDDTTYIPVTESFQTVVAGAAHLWNVTGANYRWVRLFWDRSAGTGTLTAKLTLKEFFVRLG